MLAPGRRGQFHPIGEYQLDIRCEIGRLVKFHDFADRLGKDARRFARRDFDFVVYGNASLDFRDRQHPEYSPMSQIRTMPELCQPKQIACQERMLSQGKPMSLGNRPNHSMILIGHIEKPVVSI